jgi:soluble lytic murein transglycosylase
MRAGASALLVALSALVAADGCGADPSSATTPAPPWLSAPLAASRAPAQPSAPLIDPVDGSIADPNVPVFDVGKIRPVLDDPRLSKVKELAAKEAHRGAAKELTEILKKKPPEADEEPRWQYQLGRLRLLGGDPLGAVRAFDRAAAADWPLADYARFIAGDLLARTKQPAEGLARLTAVKRGTALDDELDLAIANAHARNHEVDKSVPLWDAYLAKKPRPRGWQLVALHYAKALLNDPSVPHAEKAVSVARIVVFESPNGRGVGEARELEEKALLTIPHERRKVLKRAEVMELTRRARALSEARQARFALATAKKAIAKLSHDGPSPQACDAYIAKGKALELLRRRSEASDVLGVAIERCKGFPRRVVALFLGGRNALKSGQASLARKRYALLEKEFPTHSFADDARLHGARAVAHLGDIAASTKMLLTIGDDYPTGDMVDEALYSLAHDRIVAGDWGGAVNPLKKAIARKKRGRTYYAEGRPQYYLARAEIELGATEKGLEMLEGVIRDFPASYYMVHAYARLASHDQARAAKVVRDAMHAEPSGHLVIPDHGELHRAEFLRATELVRQGDGKRALAELDRLGVRQKTAHPSLLWASAFLLAKIDAPAESHGLLRSSPGLWREHYPAGVWQSVWQVAYPRPFHDIVNKELERSPIPEHLAYAIMREESAFNAGVVSHADAYGLMQLILPTAKHVAKRLGIKADATTLKQPATNIALGCSFLSRLQKRFTYNPVLAIPGYNAGPGAPKRWVKERPADDFDLWVEKIPYRETRRYTKRVIQSMAAYSMLYGKGMRDELLALPLVVKP